MTHEVKISDLIGFECQCMIAAYAGKGSKRLVVETLLGSNTTITRFLIYHNNGLVAIRLTLEAAIDRYNDIIIS
jgi:hypothetical protein